MAKAATAAFEELILEIEFDPDGDPGTYAKVCGITDVSINRTNNVDTTEVPDCDDESLPHYIERSTRSQEVTASGTGVWSLSANDKMYLWWKGGGTLNVRLRNAYAEANAAVGEVYEESGPAILASLNNSRTKGQKVTAEIELQFDGVPVAGTVAA